jgi:hypothetical protein
MTEQTIIDSRFWSIVFDTFSPSFLFGASVLLSTYDSDA